MDKTCGTYGGEKRCIQGFSEETSGKKPLGRPRRKWENNIKMDLREVNWGIDWIDLVEDRDGWRDVVITVLNLRVP
jgi:hypothetical protein